MGSCGTDEAKVTVVHDHGRAVEFVLIKSVESSLILILHNLLVFFVLDSV